MENNTSPVPTLKELAALLMEKLKENQTELNLDFQDLAVQGPGPQGTMGQWRVNGRINVKTKSSGNG